MSVNSFYRVNLYRIMNVNSLSYNERIIFKAKPINVNYTNNNINVNYTIKN